MQDHLYLGAAAKLGLSRMVTDMLLEVVPRVLSRAEKGKPPSFAVSSFVFESARYRLGRAIAARMADPSSPLPPQ